MTARRAGWPRRGLVVALGVAADNPGLSGAADFYAGVILPEAGRR